MRPNAVSGEPLLVDNLISRYAVDCITRTVYSVDVSAAKNPDNDFSKHSSGIFNASGFSWIVLAPWLAGLFKIALTNRYTQDRVNDFSIHLDGRQ